MTRFSTPIWMQSFFYFGFNRKPYEGDEAFGISIGRLYLGYYTHDEHNLAIGGWCFGILDEHGCLPLEISDD